MNYSFDLFFFFIKKHKERKKELARGRLGLVSDMNG
jgi:hypothetical protein